jgi:hypothetical protein
MVEDSAKKNRADSKKGIPNGNRYNLILRKISPSEGFYSLEYDSIIRTNTGLGVSALTLAKARRYSLLTNHRRIASRSTIYHSRPENVVPPQCGACQKGIARSQDAEQVHPVAIGGCACHLMTCRARTVP